MPDCLHCEINKLVEAIVLEAKEPINVPDIASRMAESLADLILNAAPPEEQAKLIAHTLSEFGRFLIERNEPEDGGTTH